MSAREMTQKRTNSAVHPSSFINTGDPKLRNAYDNGNGKG